MKPPFTITQNILNNVADICTKLGDVRSLSKRSRLLKLRRENMIRSIYSSCAIEGNHLTLEQVTDIINGKRVAGPINDIHEIKNAYQAYDHLKNYDVLKMASLLKAHKVLMKGLVKEPGQFRQGQVVVRDAHTIYHVAPPAKRVSQLMADLFQFLKQQQDLHPLIKSSIFHYEFEFIHPFEDGNGRMGRLWQTAILYHHLDTVFEAIPIETAIHKHQQAYYKALQSSTKKSSATPFVEFMLQVILEALDLVFAGQMTSSAMDRLAVARKYFTHKPFKRKQYMALFTGLSSATASRDLAKGVKEKILKKSGDKNATEYGFGR